MAFDSRVLVVTALLSMASAAHATPEVFVVDASGGPGSDFVFIDGAIQAASDGDVVVVRTGSYDPFAVDGKSIVVIADDGAFVAVNYTTTVRQIAAGQQLIVSGIQLGPTALPVFISNNDGAVWLHDCYVVANPTGTPGSADAMHADRSAAVLISDSIVEGALFGGASGCVADESELYVWDSTLGGGRPNDTLADGGAGLQLTDGFLYASNSYFRGGDGTDGFDAGQCFGPGDGGDGLALVASGAPTSAVLSEVAMSAGNAGQSADGCPDGTDGLPSSLSGGAAATEVSLVGGVRSYRLSQNLIRSGETFDMVFEGAPGDFALLAVTKPGSPVYLPAGLGAAISLNGVQLLSIGAIPAGGVISVPTSVSLPAGFDNLVFKTQSVFLDGINGFLLGSPAPAVVVDASL